MKAELSKDLARLWRAESARLHAALMWQCRDLSLAEDALQDAFLQACKQWPREGLPANPVAWMHSVAKRRLIDRLRQSRVRQTSQADSSLQLQVEWRNSRCPPNAAIPDDRLRLIFTCCHPALSREAQIALTLKIVCGLSSAEIARAFVVSADTLDRRLSRAKQKIALAGIAYEVPEGEALKRRLPEVLAVIYLLFNESFQATEGPSLSRENLALEAIRLGRLLFELQPSAEAGGLLALMELHWARASARHGDQRGFIPLEEQDRSRWDHATISRASEFLYQVMSRRTAGPYQLQAAVSALHARAPSFDRVDWPQIAGLYSALERLQPSPVVSLNHLVAMSYVDPPAQILPQLEQLAEPLARYQPYYAALADIARRARQWVIAGEAYRHAIDLSQNEAEREFLTRRLQALELHPDAD